MTPDRSHSPRTARSHAARAVRAAAAAWFAFLVAAPVLDAGPSTRLEESRAARIAARYEKREVHIPMRDGARLFTAIYRPRDARGPLPVLLRRTPYGVAPYGADLTPDRLGPSERLEDEGFVFVLQDVRGCYLSEGEFRDMTPHHVGPRGPADVDESTDTFDTVEWLLGNVEGLNGRVGQWGISYPGFYAAAGMIDAHPALVAVSPQAPIADWYFDDFHHHGAFFLPHAFNFLASFGRARPAPTTERPPRFDHGTPDGYRFFLDLGPLRNADALHLKGEVAFWNEMVAHPDYDEFWQERNLLPHLERNRVAPAVLTVGGWFDAEDLYGPLQIYRAIEGQSDEGFNALVMGPWAHGGWARGEGDRLGIQRFGSATSRWYQENVEAPFFLRHLADRADAPPVAEATVFETGANRWRTFDAWPPAGLEARTLFASSDGGLTARAPTTAGSDAFLSDPDRPVPFTEDVATGMTREYMTDDQRFAARRPDVLVYQTAPLEDDLTVAGPLTAELFVSTTGSDADWVVKLIDVHPDDAEDPEDLRPGRRMGGCQAMVRSEVFRGRYREGYDAPRPFSPGVVARVAVPLQDVLHTFRRGHRIMVHVQSTWFPLVDRNPQRFVPNIFAAEEADFVPAVHRVHRSPGAATALHLRVLPATPSESTSPPADGSPP